MNSRDRVLEAMACGEPDRVPCALSFYHIEIEGAGAAGRLPTGLVDVEMVEFPLSPEEKALDALARPYAPDTRLGTPAQTATYARWSYRPQVPAMPARWRVPGRWRVSRAFPFADRAGSHRRGGNGPPKGNRLTAGDWRAGGPAPSARATCSIAAGLVCGLEIAPRFTRV